MKQILQNLKTGATEVAEVPCPAVMRSGVLIRTRRTLISTGTERMLVEFGRANMLDKARQQPDRVKQVIQKIGTDGLKPTLDAVRNKLDQPLALGYSNVGIIAEVGAMCGKFKPGDRVLSNGKHAEVVTVPQNLCARIPDAVSDDEAAFTVVGAIALQGVRLSAPTLGETCVVSGLGLIGLMTVQLLRANGCRVLATDFDPARLALAQKFGAEVIDLASGTDPVRVALELTGGIGVDAVIVTASTKSSAPITQAAHMSRKRGRIVLVGVTGLTLSRADFYEKELSFQVSCSYGPGRYDSNYEEKGLDYPIGFVRWTEQRNFEAVLGLMADGRLDVKPMISHRFPIAEATRAYELVGGAEPSLGVLLDYPLLDEKPDEEIFRRKFPLSVTRSNTESRGVPRVGVIGAGNYASSVLIPAFKSAGVDLATVISSAGVTAFHVGHKHEFAEISTDAHEMIEDPLIDTIVIATRHDSHASLVLAALEARKNVFVEKPLAITSTEVDAIEAKLAALDVDGGAPQLMVGFNRRFSPHIQTAKALLDGAEGPKALVMTVNAGEISSDHWVHDPEVGGGRIIGEACHFIDLLRFLAGHPIESANATRMKSPTGDSASISLSFEDGSIGTVHYFANGHKSLPKERLEVFCSGKVLEMRNFQKMTGAGWQGFSKQALWTQNKGQTACAKAFVEAIATGVPAIPLQELMEVARVTIDLG